MSNDDTSIPENVEMYVDFDAFMKQAIHEFYQQGGKNKRARFIALLIASGEVGSLAVDTLKSEEGLKKIALGAAGVAALRVGLKYAVSGPLGVVLAGAAAASLVAYFIRNRAEITSKIGRYRELVAAAKISFEKILSDHRDRRFDGRQRDLMVDGLMKRLLADLNE